ncbi:MAG: alpha/beta hydrolase [Blastocatellia bacterium]|nr:alpha/beta hydrolase [Blastocatellia bacterium]
MRLEKKSLPLRFLCVSAVLAFFLFQSVPFILAQGNSKKAEKIEFTPFELTDFNGKKVQAERGRLKVPENRSRPSGNTIELAVVRLKSKSDNPAIPIVYLAGGPGGSAIGEARFPHMMSLFERLQQTRDIIFMDQRGTGQSTPLVAWPAPASLPADAFLSEEKMLAVVREASSPAIESFKKRNIDLAGYNSVESADDINDLRLALGLEKIGLIGFSYGTHLGLVTIRRHSKHLDSVVLVGTEGPDHTLKLPSTYDAQIRKLSDLAAQDSEIAGKVPDMAALLKRILARLEKEPITVKVQDQRTRQPVDVKVGKFGLQMIIRMDVGDGNDFPEFPALFHTIDRGDYSLLAKYVGKRYNQFGRGLSGMSTMMDLYSGATAERLARIKRETPTSILGNVMNFPDMYIADLWGDPDLGDEYRSPILTDTRTLFISGTLDSNTPPYQAEELRWGFSKGTHIIVEYAGHEDMLPDAAVQAAIVDFLNGKDVSGVRVSLGKPKFKAIP